jgi:hypothetical protein
MSLVAVITWFVTICFGLLLLGIWLVEYDRDGPSGSASRLPLPVLSGHALLAVAGVPVWLVYIVTDDAQLAKVSALILVGVTVLGLIMLARWIGAYRARHASAVPVAAMTATTAFGNSSSGPPAVPPERSFPVAVVLFHGIFAVITVALVLLTAFDIVGS